MRETFGALACHEGHLKHLGVRCIRALPSRRDVHSALKKCLLQAISPRLNALATVPFYWMLEYSKWVRVFWGLCSAVSIISPLTRFSLLEERMLKVIWSCWLQGRENAHDLVKRCLASWEAKNPGWEFRCLDAHSVARYVSVDRYFDLSVQQLTAASLSDIVRILLLHEYGGVWVDATLYCNQALDEWLPAAVSNGFFAFRNRGPDRLLSSWFLACLPGNLLLGKWAAKSLGYWKGRARSTDCFWLHHQFGELCSLDSEARHSWEAVPKISADGPHSVQMSGEMFAPFAGFKGSIDWTSPVFKLSHHVDWSAYQPGCVLHQILQQENPRVDGGIEVTPLPGNGGPKHFAGLKVATENLGDHIQIIAANRLLKRIGITPEVLLDRDDEIASAPQLEGFESPVGILLNGWHKTNPAEWPPHPKFDPIYFSFHIRLFQSPTLLEAPALAHYRKHSPIGCRDCHTAGLLKERGVEAFVSQCISLLNERRLPSPRLQTETYVVARDRRIIDFVADKLGPFEFICQYSGSHDFAENMRRAGDLLTRYQERARLIVTTQLHCALPAIAMGIPCVVFYPPNKGSQHASDRERFSSLEQIIPVFHLARAREVDWNGYLADVSYLKLRLLDRFYEMTRKWRLPRAVGLGPVAPTET